ncbi:MAG: chorismate mutase [Prolixibacteraceae bacterium]|nr:chorismate mutase [Prolixibacteraceae bacterium]
MDQIKKPDDCLNIEEIRQEIDKIDKKIIELFSLRDDFVKEIVTFKKDKEGVIAQERKEFVINERARMAGEIGLNPDLFKKIFTILIEDNIKKELELLHTNGIKSI